ncbi:dTDP-4-amino-4,6-dideoxygalactose transaminase [Amycolatopsis bartoniae]|uniref:Aminotransferase DegT n=1 Tax=Amycolatopsis bartoniae TaxID=941986 RepID=A0A8H9MD78_9PSEU|nr:DegT/DnrJ/EryC1/StrS family aminotransferase [Amycolatopsis bartoniae]MBB2933537.1 dTDP-4-amino-4,6-dideoxygalactose transaminase [Amycolatopsis bartoniae]TVT07632.1 DegT/DnrJ/EryC1/StrS aminotransferase [Amycolatopsis bartoniae]GHF60174.1 aminotransferase DegT [Amycolatopsis bartoniae]
MIPLVEPVLGERERRYVMEAFDTGYVSSVGPFVDRFEREFADAVSVPHAVACSSGTAALHVAMRLAGAGPGSVVAAPTFTFIASVNAIQYTGADIWLVDSEPGTWNMDTQLIRDEVVRRARLGRRIPDIVEVVHVLGHPADIEPVLELKERFGIAVVEDAAEALGATWRTGPLGGRQVGSVGDFGCFSFNGNKTITTGGGGMIVGADAQAARRAKSLTTQAREPGVEYWHEEVGYNYRLTNLAAALGTAQLEELPGILRAKHDIAGRYDEWLGGTAVSCSPHAPWADPSYWMYSVLLPAGGPAPRQATEALLAEGVQTRPLWPPVHAQKPYVGCLRIGGDVAESVYARGLSLPSSSNLTSADQKHVVRALTGMAESWAG